MSRIPARVITDVLDRADLHCEACGLPWRDPMVFHHRLMRSAGGGDETCNLMWVHNSCHNLHQRSIHQNPERSYAFGHLLHRGEDPLLVPFKVCRGMFVDPELWLPQVPKSVRPEACTDAGVSAIDSRQRE